MRAFVRHSGLHIVGGTERMDTIDCSEREVLLRPREEVPCRRIILQSAEPHSRLLRREDWKCEGLQEVAEGSEGLQPEEEQEHDLSAWKENHRSEFGSSAGPFGAAKRVKSGCSNAEQRDCVRRILYYGPGPHTARRGSQMAVRIERVVHPLASSLCCVWHPPKTTPLIIIINHLVIPSLKTWLRSSSRARAVHCPPQ